MVDNTEVKLNTISHNNINVILEKEEENLQSTDFSKTKKRNLHNNNEEHSDSSILSFNDGFTVDDNYIASDDDNNIQHHSIKFPQCSNTTKLLSNFKRSKIKTTKDTHNQLLSNDYNKTTTCTSGCNNSMVLNTSIEIKHYQEEEFKAKDFYGEPNINATSKVVTYDNDNNVNYLEVNQIEYCNCVLF